jgi:hypothetical protein
VAHAGPSIARDKRRGRRPSSRSLFKLRHYRNLGLTRDGRRGRISKLALPKSKPATTISKSGATISKSAATKSKYDSHIFQWLGLNSGTSPQSRSRSRASQPPLSAWRKGRASAETAGQVVSVSLSVFLSPVTRGAGSDRAEYDTEYGKWEERSEFIVLGPSPVPSGWRDSRALLGATASPGSPGRAGSCHRL